MNDVVIRAEGLGKKYLIGHQSEESYTALRDILARQCGRLVRSACDLMAGRPLVAGDAREEIWPLRDVNFEIRRGEVVGIVGRNGAGKSTLLKILSRITDPSEGRVVIEGRVASLLEVGTGFHPELTGRENIYLNGAILGMTHAEIRRKFDEIVDFAGVEQFLDTPVKRYSSGMYVRLAFSVAAHLEPEILVVDEVLAVGDAEFQNKCLRKMETVAGQGRTVLFVSHNRAAIARLCQKAIWLDAGTVRENGGVETILNAYTGAFATSISDVTDRRIEGKAYFHNVSIQLPDGAQAMTNMTPLAVQFHVVQERPSAELRLSVGICNSNGEMIFATGPSDSGLTIDGAPGEHFRTLTVPPMTFLPKRYEIRAYLWSPFEKRVDSIEGLFFDVEPDTGSPIKLDGRSGMITIPCEWTSEPFQKSPDAPRTPAVHSSFDEPRQRTYGQSQ